MRKTINVPIVPHLGKIMINVPQMHVFEHMDDYARLGLCYFLWHFFPRRWGPKCSPFNIHVVFICLSVFTKRPYKWSDWPRLTRVKNVVKSMILSCFFHLRVGR
jgi:hypothetical protein